MKKFITAFILFFAVNAIAQPAYPGAIPIAGGFKLGALPVDAKTVVNSLDSLAGIAKYNGIITSVLYSHRPYYNDFGVAKGIALLNDVDNKITNYDEQNPIITFLQKPHTFIAEDRLRRKNVDWSGVYTGTIRTVGSGGTYSTIMAAVSAAADGDIIQILDGTYPMESEPGSFLNFASNKKLLIRGNATNNKAVVLQQTTNAASFCCRFSWSNQLTIQNLTIQTNQANPAVTMYVNSPSLPNNILFDNCIIKNTSTAVVRTVNIQGLPANVNYFEFKNCDIHTCTNTTGNSVAVAVGFESEFNDTNAASYPSPVLITGGHIYGWQSWRGGAVDLSMYDVICEQNTYASPYVFGFGRDTEAPFSTTSKLDVRGCTFKYSSNYQGHSVLLGRGTKNIYFVNNNVFVPQSNPDTGLALGIVVKSIAAVVGDVVISGNYVVAPRPLYIKGGQYNIINYNTVESTWTANDTGAGWEINNPNNVDGPLTSQGNMITFNRFIGKVAGGITTTAAGATDAFISAQACKIDYNAYQVKTSNVVYFAKESLANVTNWTGKTALWGNDNDSHSIWHSYYVDSNMIKSNEAKREVYVNGSGEFSGEVKAAAATSDNSLTNRAYTNTYYLRNIKTDTNESTVLTATTTETILKSYLLPANALSEGNLVFNAVFEKSGVANTATFKIYKNTTNSLSGATQIGIYTKSAGTLLTFFDRRYFIRGSLLYGYSFTTSIVTPTTSGGGLSSVSFTPTVDNYIIITGQLTDSADSVKVADVQITFTKTN
jgi:hypothetical protein